MEFMDKVNEIAKKVSDKAGDVVEMGKLTAKIHSENAEADALKKQIGEICFGKYRSGDELDPEIEKLCREIEKHKHNIAENQRTLNRMKQSDSKTVDPAAAGFCPYCGEKLVKDAKFCPACGKELR